MARRIYLASSWRNARQPEAVQLLRAAGHEVYDFRNPAPGNDGFRWSEIDPDWLHWQPEPFIKLLTTHPVARDGFGLDKAALDWCDTCVLLLPSGRSAHLEAGYAIGRGKQALIVLDEVGFEPELMYLLADRVVPHVSAMVAALDEMAPAAVPEMLAALRLSADRLDQITGNPEWSAPARATIAKAEGRA